MEPVQVFESEQAMFDGVSDLLDRDPGIEKRLDGLDSDDVPGCVHVLHVGDDHADRGQALQKAGFALCLLGQGIESQTATHGVDARSGRR